ncbi:MAG: hypothetical protein F7B18_02020 [Desulfurococcales archaeon]|nr:hypothetical protein [Desulfurococcales archaeon]
MAGSDPVLDALRKLVAERERYFDRMDVLNSDGRRLLASAARVAAKRGFRVSAKRAWRYLKNPTFDEALRLIARWD